MGLFGLGKKKETEIDMDKCKASKQRFREIFNEAVEDGDTYQILHAGATESQFNKGLVLDSRTTTFFNYIVGYRRSDYKVAVVETDKDLTQYGEPCYITMDQVMETNYYPKYCQAWFIYKKGIGPYGVKLEVSDTRANSMYMTPNIDQGTEREQFLDFLEEYTDKLREQGFKIKQWKR